MSIGKLKAAKRLVSKFLESKGVSLRHSDYLELIARAHLFKDWNTAEGVLSSDMTPKTTRVEENCVPDWLQLPNGIEYVITYEFDTLTDDVLSEWDLRLGELRVKSAAPADMKVMWQVDGTRVIQRWTNLGSGNNILTLALMQHAYLHELGELTVKSAVFDRLSRSTEKWEPLKYKM